MSQMTRFGLLSSPYAKMAFSGKLKGSREDLTKVIHSYGFEVEVVRATS